MSRVKKTLKASSVTVSAIAVICLGLLVVLAFFAVLGSFLKNDSHLIALAALITALGSLTVSAKIYGRQKITDFFKGCIRPVSQELVGQKFTSEQLKDFALWNTGSANISDIFLFFVDVKAQTMSSVVSIPVVKAGGKKRLPPLSEPVAPTTFILLFHRTLYSEETYVGRWMTVFPDSYYVDVERRQWEQHRKLKRQALYIAPVWKFFVRRKSRKACFLPSPLSCKTIIAKNIEEVLQAVDSVGSVLEVLANRIDKEKLARLEKESVFVPIDGDQVSSEK